MNDSLPTEHNSTSSNEASYAIPFTSNVVLIVLSTWIVISLFHHGRKTGKWKQMHRRNQEKLDAGLMYISTVTCACFLVARLICSQIFIHIGQDHHPASCDIISHVMEIFYYLVLFSVEFFLWLRQWLINSNEMLGINLGKWFIRISTYSLVVVIVVWLGVILINTIPFEYNLTEDGCVLKALTDGRKHWFSITCNVAVVVGQFMLVNLFVYPLRHELDCRNSTQNCLLLVRTKANKKDFRSTKINIGSSPSLIASEVTINSAQSSSQFSINSQMGKSELNLPASPFAPQKYDTVQRLRRNNRSSTLDTLQRQKRSVLNIKRFMHRTIIFAILSILTDICVVIIQSIYQLETGEASDRRISITIHDINAFLNVLFIICTFINWTELLTSPFVQYDD